LRNECAQTYANFGNVGHHHRIVLEHHLWAAWKTGNAQAIG
jgi:hypothetical protein